MVSIKSVILTDRTDSSFPTGNLDKKNSEIVFEIFNQLSTEDNQGLLVVTYDPGFTANTNRIIEMEDGRIIKNGKAILF